ncbi:MAG: hypothetical protein Q4B17_08055 [Lautropia sp.]|nr:hypothetical protein [Lautropia sp.]
MVLTPYYQIAVNNGLGTINELSPYRETLRSFQALPILDWGMLFKPYHWGFLVLPAANAFSLYFLLMTLSFVAGWAIFFRLLRLPAWSAALLASTLYFSPMIQTWWTSNAGVLALGPWTMIFWLQIEHRLLRIAACAYALLVWMLSCAYPPFLYAIGFAMAALVICFRMDKLGWGRIADGGFACAIALPLFIEYFDELIDIMQATVYPGQRISSSGGLGWPKLLAHLYPSLTTHIFEPLASIPNSNAAEITVLSSLLPLYAICLIDYQRLTRLIRTRPLPFCLLLCFCLFITAWLMFYIPPFIAKITGLTMVPSGRAVMAFGLLINTISVLALARAGIVLTARRLCILLALTLLGTAGKLLLSTQGLQKLYGPIDTIPYLCLIVLAANLFRPSASQATRPLGIVLSAALLGNLLAYGLFNPVQSAYPIFEQDKVQIRQRMAERDAKVMEDGTIAVPGHYGALLAGTGLRSINHVLYYPQLDYFRTLFPALPPDELNALFNRYAHISVGDTDGPRLVAPDHVQLPLSAFPDRMLKASPPSPAASLQVLDTRPAAPAAASQSGHIDSMAWQAATQLQLKGWVYAPMSADTRVRIWSSQPLESQTLNTHARPDVASAIARSLLDSGIVLDLVFLEAPMPGAMICVEVEARPGGTSTVQFPNGDKGCTHLPPGPSLSVPQ